MIRIRLQAGERKAFPAECAGREYYERGLGVITAFDEFEARVRNDNFALQSSALKAA